MRKRITEIAKATERQIIAHGGTMDEGLKAKLRILSRMANTDESNIYSRVWEAVACCPTMMERDKNATINNVAVAIQEVFDV